MLTPSASRIIVRPKKAEEKTDSGIILTASETDLPGEGEVVAVGSEVRSLYRGQNVIFKRYSAAEVEHEGEKLLILDVADVLARVG